jgi:DNA adenine methylase
VKPLIKWPGGKSREFSIISDHIPEFSRYIEPFFGGGAILFKIKPNEAYVNDIDSQLIIFYNAVKSQSRSFFLNLQDINDDWNFMTKIVNCLVSDYIDLFTKISKYINQPQFSNEIKTMLIEKRSYCLPTSMKYRYIDPSKFQNYLLKSIISKTWRISRLQIKHKKIFSNDELYNHLETGIKSAYYFYLRDEVFNQNRDETGAVFYFIREFCYGSMFRFNKNGEFNIPYGGINYNKKDFQSKIQKLNDQSIKDVLDKITFSNRDFIDFLERFSFSKDDFIFLDPPYDSDFKDYGKHPFTRRDQERLGNYLAQCKSKWLLIIQENNFIRDLYKKIQLKNDKITMERYQKQYTYNVRGRNERKVSHLLIKNY